MSSAGLHQSLSQNQTLAPQMRQSLEILQANTMELSQLIQAAMSQNPVLEDVSTSESLDETDKTEDEGDILSQMDDDWRELAIIERRNSSSSADDEARREFLFNSIVAPETLQQHLAEQINMADARDEVKDLALVLIGDLDDHGFFESDIEELNARMALDPIVSDKAKALIQALEPAGVGGRDLRESLLLQLERRGEEDTPEYRIVDQHLSDLARHKFPQIAKALSISIERVTEAAEHIGNLNPDPGSAFEATANPHVVPDVVIEKTREGEFVARLTNEFLPRLQISNLYKDMVGTLDSESRSAQKARTYLRQNIRDGRTLIRAVGQRQQTILGIAELLIEKQPEFLAQGPRHLRPLTMNEVAEVIGVHATTVSRAVAGKYIMTPHGLMEMRAFFATGYTAEDGSEVSSEGVRQAIQALVDGEDPAKPLSDSAIEKLLKKQGVKVARRTVAKYREQLNILPSHLRRKYA